jgi:serine/threonine-protein kinase RsbW
MELIVNNYNHFDLVEVTGRIDSYTTPRIDSALRTLMTDDHYNIIVDLQNVNFISSSGILTFVNIQRKLIQQDKGEIVFMHVPDLVYQSFAIAGFDTIFEFFNDLDTAKGWFLKDSMVKTKIYPGNYKSLATISQFIVEQAEEAGFSLSDIYAIQTAVDEACSNIIDHAYGGENLGIIKIKVMDFKNKIHITLVDQGVPFVPEDVPEPDITSPLEIRKERGLGIFFMRNLMDKVQFEFSATEGNTLTMVKYKGE